MDVREAPLALCLKQADLERVIAGLAKWKTGHVGDVHKSIGRFCVGTRANADTIAEQLCRAYRASRQQEFFFVSLNVRLLKVARVFLLEHDAAGTVEELCAGFGKLTLVLCDLAEHSQGQRILVDVLDSAAREMNQNTFGIDFRKFLGKKGERIVTRERLKRMSERPEVASLRTPSSYALRITGTSASERVVPTGRRPRARSSDR